MFGQRVNLQNLVLVQPSKNFPKLKYSVENFVILKFWSAPTFRRKWEECVIVLPVLSSVVCVPVQVSQSSCDAFELRGTYVSFFVGSQRNETADLQIPFKPTQVGVTPTNRLV